MVPLTEHMFYFDECLLNVDIWQEDLPAISSELTLLIFKVSTMNLHEEKKWFPQIT
jgi:hypothetical protein